MCVQLFGKNDSPCIANYTLKRTINDNKEAYSDETIKDIENSFYMDDFLNSQPTKEKMCTIVKEACEILSTGSFRLTKWLSNSEDVLNSIDRTEISDKVSSHSIERVLGMLWNFHSDTLAVKVEHKNVPETKRGILSYISTVFDPIGILSPLLLTPKLIVQELWKMQYDWDEQISEPILTKWRRWKETFEQLENVKLPRWYGFHIQEVKRVELHVFADASTQAYAATVYLRSINNKGNIKSSFVIAKSRLAPLNMNTLSIPKLELQAAVIAARLKTTVISELTFKPHSVYIWSDSKTVLRYIKNEHKHFPRHVMHRVNEIREITSSKDWYYIPSELNIADICTRPMPLSKYQTFEANWLGGPAALTEPIERFIDNELNLDLNTNQESKDFTINEMVTSDMPKPSDKIIIWERYSKFAKLIRCVAWILKLKRNWILKHRNKEETQTNFVLLPSDLEESILSLCQIAQNETFSREKTLIQSSKPLPHNSSLISLKPLILNHLLCVGGRLKNANIPLASRHQIILPASHPISRLILSEIHQNNFHAGREHCLSISRQKYWIVRGKNLARKIVKECFTCKKRNVQPQPCLMGNLPKERLGLEEHPFTYTRVDFFGPFNVKYTRGTRSTKATIKRYGVLFTCLTIRAVHLEIAGDLSTDKFILALRRFIARRGKPKIMMSDNGTNFVGANKELQTSLQKLDQSKIVFCLTDYNIEWKFNPPIAPWMGGAWESMVKLTKRALYTIISNRTIHEDLLVTLFCEIEYMLNSRPLVELSDEPNDFQAITPNHFVCKSFNNPCPGDFDDKVVNYKKQWKSLQLLSNMFWKIFIKAYVPFLNKRQKWFKNSRNFKPNDLVLVVNDNLPRSFWQMGRILSVFKGADNVVRSAEVRLPNTTLKRPTSKLCLLEGAN